MSWSGGWEGGRGSQGHQVGWGGKAGGGLETQLAVLDGRGYKAIMRTWKCTGSVLFSRQQVCERSHGGIS